VKRGYTAQVCLIQKYLDSARGIAYKDHLRNPESAVDWRMIDFFALADFWA
jgi:hypothetical protein